MAMPAAAAVHRQFAGAVSHRSCNAPPRIFLHVPEYEAATIKTTATPSATPANTTAQQQRAHQHHHTSSFSLAATASIFPLPPPPFILLRTPLRSHHLCSSHGDHPSRLHRSSAHWKQHRNTTIAPATRIQPAPP